LRRGPYIVASGMDEVDHLRPEILPGNFINLFDAKHTVLADPVIRADSRWLLYDLAHCPDHPGVIVAAGRLREECFDKQTLAFVVESMAKTTTVIRARIPAKPNRITLKCSDGSTSVQYLTIHSKNSLHQAFLLIFSILFFCCNFI
jgi:hypothetical protein